MTRPTGSTRIFFIPCQTSLSTSRPAYNYKRQGIFCETVHKQRATWKKQVVACLLHLWQTAAGIIRNNNDNSINLYAHIFPHHYFHIFCVTRYVDVRQWRFWLVYSYNNNNNKGVTKGSIICIFYFRWWVSHPPQTVVIMIAVVGHTNFIDNPVTCRQPNQILLFPLLTLPLHCAPFPSTCHEGDLQNMYYQ